MDLKEIRESGLLEQYSLGLLSEEESILFETYLEMYPELRNDFKEIQFALLALAKENGIKPKPELEQSIVDYVRVEAKDMKPTSKNVESSIAESSSPKSKSGSNSMINALLIGSLALAVGLLGFSLMKNIKNNTSQIAIVKLQCDSTLAQKDSLIDFYETLLKPEFKKLTFTPTDKFSEIELQLFNNNVSRTNYIKINRLPVIQDDQSFQLWSLKPGSDPIPLDTFNVKPGQTVAVKYEEGTATYAITIEKKGGSLVPNLDLLIGTVGV